MVKRKKVLVRVLDFWSSVVSSVFLVVFGGSMAYEVLSLPPFLSFLDPLAVFVGWFFVIVGIFNFIVSLVNLLR